MLSDVHSNVRFNAATGLARHGDARGVEVLREMIDPGESVAGDLDLPAAGTNEDLSDEAKVALRADREAMIRFSGLSAVEKLANANAKVELAKIGEAIQTLIDQSGTHPRVKSKAVEVKNLLKGRS
jgi:hypothetical protein